MTIIQEICKWYQEINIDTINVYNLLNENESLGQLYKRLSKQNDLISNYLEEQFLLYLRGKNTRDASTDVLKKHNLLQGKILQIFVNRNNDGILFEKEGKLDLAIKCYEDNISDGFWGTHPYERLMIIYRKNKLYDDEIRVIKEYIKIEGTHSNNIQSFESRLAKVLELKSKQKTGIR